MYGLISKDRNILHDIIWDMLLKTNLPPSLNSFPKDIFFTNFQWHTLLKERLKL